MLAVGNRRRDCDVVSLPHRETPPVSSGCCVGSPRSVQYYQSNQNQLRSIEHFSILYRKNGSMSIAFDVFSKKKQIFSGKAARNGRFSAVFGRFTCTIFPADRWDTTPAPGRGCPPDRCRSENRRGGDSHRRPGCNRHPPAAAGAGRGRAR